MNKEIKPGDWVVVKDLNHYQKTLEGKVIKVNASPLSYIISPNMIKVETQDGIKYFYEESLLKVMK